MNKIVLISGRAGAGKDTVADMLSNLIYNKGLEINSSYYACKIAFAAVV
jgi:uridine kinase